MSAELPLNPINTNSLENLPNHPETGPRSRYEVRKSKRELEKYEPRKLRMALGIVGVSLAVTTSFAVSETGRHIAQDIEVGKEAVKDSHAQIHDVYIYPDKEAAPSTHGTFVLTGVGTKSSYGTAEILEPHKDTGSVFALEYGNDDIDTVDMAKRVIKTAEEYDIREISFDGFSAGGPIALDIAAHIHTTEPDLHINAITLNSSPIGEGSLTETSEQGVEIMNAVLSIYPDFKYYEDGRAMIEVINRHSRYLEREDAGYSKLPTVLDKNKFQINGSVYILDYEQLAWEIDDITKKMEETSVASASLIKSQVDFITLTDYDKNIKILSEPGVSSFNDRKTLLIYTRSLLPEDDQVVDIETSESNFKMSVRKQGNVYTVVREDIGHANPNERREEYASMLKEKINPLISSRVNLSARMYNLHELEEESYPNQAKQAE